MARIEPVNFLERVRKARDLRMNGGVDRATAPEPAAPAGRPLTALERLRALSVVANEDDQGEFAAGTFESSSRGDGSPSVALSQATEEIFGTLSSVRVFNDWAVGAVWTEDREEVRVTGEVIAGLTEGLEYRFKGVKTNHARHGEGIEVSSYEPVISADPRAIARYLEKSFRGIGPSKAKKFIDRVQELAVEKAWEDAVVRAEPLSGQDVDDVRQKALTRLRDKLLHEPWKLDLTALSKDASFAEGEDPQSEAKRLVLTRNLMLRLGGMPGFRESVAKSLAVYLLEKIKAQGDQADAFVDPIEKCWGALVENPYAPIKKAAGYGFSTAELVASSIGVPRDSGLRLAALVEYAVEEECQRRGHTYLTANGFVSAVNKVDPSAPAQASLIYGVKAGLLRIDPTANRVYVPELFAAETRLAKSIAKLISEGDPLTARSAESVEKKLRATAGDINPAFANGLDVDQIKAVSRIMTSPSRLHVLTGGPGTGKTAIIECLVSLLKGRSFLFAAPTGKASKVLTSRVKSMGHRSSTTCSLLRGSEDAGFAVNASEPLECDVLVIDESTMNGVVMADALLQALPASAHVIFLGDPGRLGKDSQVARAGQLPSISPGRFMYDLMEIEEVDQVHLTKTWRNSGGILEVVQEVSLGKLNVEDREAVGFHSLPDPVDGFPKLMREYLESVTTYGIENTALGMPKRKGDRLQPGWNTTYANHVLQAILNPNAQKLPGTTLHVGDRVILRKNMNIKQPGEQELGRVVASSPLAAISAAASGSSKDPALLDFSRLNGPADDDTDDERCEVIAVSDVPTKDEAVVNGDTGTIIGFSMDGQNTRLGSAKWVQLALDDGREVWYPGAEVSYVDHGYALTIHAMQGSEYAKLIAVVTPGHSEFMNQNMLLTMFSRAKAGLSVYGDPAVLKKVAETPMPKRNSGLVDAVRVELEVLREAEALTEESEPTEA